MRKNYKNNGIEDKRLLAQFDETAIRVYQVYNRRIAEEVVSLGTFGSCFKMERMTWIKTSFLWMMYRSGWATKEEQERILAIDIKRLGFNVILENAVLSAFKEEIYDSYDDWKLQFKNSEVRCQWDPDRDIYETPLNRRTIQLGIKGSLVKQYVNDWIVRISDSINHVIQLREAIELKTFKENMLPVECRYPLDENMRITLGIENSGKFNLK